MSGERALRSDARLPQRIGMKRILLALTALAVLAVMLVAGHLALIEIGREVVTLRTRLRDGGWQETRLWIVDDAEGSWLHSAGADWQRRFIDDPVVEVERAGRVRLFTAHAVTGPHPHVDHLLREKYGLADRWVRLIGPCGEGTLPVRLVPLRPD